MKDLKKEMVGYKISLLRNLYIQHEKPSNSTLTVKKKAILKQMEEIFEEVKGETLFSESLSFLQKVQTIIFTANELNFIYEAKLKGFQIVYKKFDGIFYPCIYLKSLQENNYDDLELEYQFRFKGRTSKRIMFVCPKD